MRYWFIVAVLLCLCQTGQSQDSYRWSLVAMGASQALDIHSGLGRRELNPVLGRGDFGARQIGIKLAIVGGGQLALWLAGRRHPKIRRAAAWVNFGGAAATGAVAAGNYTR